METLSAVFLRLVSMALTALPVMAVVLAARHLLRRAPRRVSYALWAVVGFRLACPVTFSQVWSLFNLAPLRPVAEATQTVGSGGLSGVRPVMGAALPPMPLPAAPEAAAALPGMQAAAAPGLSAGEAAVAAASLLWLAGMLAMLAWGAVSYLRLRRQASTAVRGEEGVWECDGIPTPFVLGLLRPRIYLPFRLTEEERAYVLAHERAHIRRGDHWVKPLAFLLLAVYWWDPAVWLCRVLCCRDMEQCCDEAVLRELGTEVKDGYSRALVAFAQERSLPTAPAFGEHDAVRRVRHVLSWRQAGPRAAFLAVAAVVLVALVCLPNADGRSRVTLGQPENDVGVTFDCDIREPVKSWALWVDVYEEGELISSARQIVDGFKEDGTGVSERRLKGTLAFDVLPSQPDEGFIGMLHCRFEGAGRFTWSILLPKDNYSGVGWMSGSFDQKKRALLDADGEMVLGSYMFSTEVENGITVPSADGNGEERRLADHNDTVVQFRLVLSTESHGNAPAGESWVRGEETQGPDMSFAYTVDEAYQSYLLYQEVYDHGTFARRQLVDVWSLGEPWPEGGGPSPEGSQRVDRLRQGTCTLRAELLEDGTGMQWWGSVPTAVPGGRDSANMGVVRWPERSFQGIAWVPLCQAGERAPLLEDTAVAVACLSEKEDGRLHAFGVPVRDEAPEDALRNDAAVVLRLRLSTDDADALAAEFQRESAALDQARALLALKTDRVADTAAVEALAQALGLGALGPYQLETGTEDALRTLYIACENNPADVISWDSYLGDQARLLLALVEDMGQVDWSYPRSGGETAAGTLRQEQADGRARRLGYQDIKDLGKMEAGLRALLEDLGGNGTDAP